MGASAAVNLSYIGQGPSASGQIIADSTSGPKAKTLYGYGTIVSGSDAVSVVVNFIDGTSTLAKTPVWVNLFYAGNSSDSSTAAALFQSGTNKLSLGAISGASSFVVNYPTVTTSGVSISFGAVIAFSS
jgi:hypothetical protein